MCILRSWLLEGTNLAHTLIWISGPQMHKIICFCCLRDPACSTLLQWPQETRTRGGDSHEMLRAGSLLRIQPQGTGQSWDVNQ